MTKTTHHGSNIIGPMKRDSTLVAEIAYPVLIADIGGTNARYQTISSDKNCAGEVVIHKTADFGRFESSISSFLGARQEDTPKTLVLAAAGPISDVGLTMTNCPWILEPIQLIEIFGFSNVILLNDFAAQALAATCLSNNSLIRIGKGNIAHNGTKLVVGAGTGLGVAAIIYSADRHILVSGEGGHADFGPRTKQDFEIWPYLEQQEGRVSAEGVLSGAGLVNTYRAVQAKNNLVPSLVKPSDVLRLANVDACSSAVETISLFYTWLGRIAGDLALVFMATGGVYLTGGVAQKLQPRLDHTEFRKAFEQKHPHEEILENIPTFLINAEFSALDGLRAFVENPTNYDLGSSSRHWRKEGD